MERFHIWKHQPIRDKANQFQYRTWPKEGRYIVSAVPNVIVQTGLYRYSFTSDWSPMVGVADLHDCLFGDIFEISKRHVGGTIIRSVGYNARKLKGALKDGTKAVQTYCITNPEDLRYGLEWMICAWLPTFLRATVAQEELPVGPEGYAEELEMMVNLSHEEWYENFVEPLLLGKVKLKEPAWDKVDYPKEGMGRSVPKSRLPKDLS
jgi:hypothetical protein